MFKNYGFNSVAISSRNNITDNDIHIVQRKRKTKLQVVSLTKSEKRSNSSSLSKHQRKGFKLSKQLSKNIDNFYRQDDWNKKSRIPNQAQKEYMLNYKLPIKNLLKKDSQLSIQKLTVSTIQTIDQSRKSKKDIFLQNPSVRTQRSRAMLFSRQQKKFR